MEYDDGYDDGVLRALYCCIIDYPIPGDFRQALTLGLLEDRGTKGFALSRSGKAVLMLLGFIEED